jgi:hypothetical protein
VIRDHLENKARLGLPDSGDQLVNQGLPGKQGRPVL